MEVEVLFDKNIYSAQAIKKAAYRFIDKFSVVIFTKESSYQCNLSFPDKATDRSVANLVDEFKKEVLDQDLRESIKEETEGVRNLILAHTFSQAGLIKDE
jgi:His-Xaa-Ser system protein HxsD